MAEPVPASEESPSPATVLSYIRELLGLPCYDTVSGFIAPSLEALLRRTRRQLLLSARYLGLTGIHRLSKDVLAARFHAALQSLAARAVAAEQELADRPHKFALGRPTETTVEVEHIPWGYGENRVTAMVVDPERLYVCWEVTDEAIERARAGLGPGGREAWLTLRVYDVTNRIFDGTNAHGYFDHSVSRTDRQWFFFIGKPASTAVVELGLKSHEGYFVRVARSGRTDFPRREPASPGGAEWLTVRAATGEVGEPATEIHSSVVTPGQIAPTAHVEPVRVWDIRHTHGETHSEWMLRDESFGTGLESAFAWEGPLIRTSWEAGPFAYPVELTLSVEERYSGTVTVRAVNGRTHIVYGPWQVVIRGLAARAERKVLAIWELHRSWEAHEGVGTHGGLHPGSIPGGASEMVAASELRLGGASELYRRGASELRYLGASEILYSGASERWLMGASEQRHAGASERKHLGASERHSGNWLGYPGGGGETETTAESLPAKS